MASERDFFVRVPEKLKPLLERRAQENDRSVAGEVRFILKQAIESPAEQSR
jgi:plasmid stability protein